MAAFSVRRIKCDEGKPACAKCLNTGRKCDGYQRRGSSSSEIMKIHPGNSMSEVLPLRNPSVEFFGSEQERRCFHFFRNKTVLQLSGFFESDLWNHWVLQACHHEPAIRHAVIALGSLHERFETEDKSVVGSNLDAVQGGFALEQYNHAIRQLIRPTSATKRPAIDVCLIACVLFACFEV